MLRGDAGLIVLLSILIFAGVILMQIRWTRGAYYLTEQQFRHRVVLALNEAIDEVSGSPEFMRDCSHQENSPQSDPRQLSIKERFDLDYLGQVISRRFDKYELEGSYRYRFFSKDETDACPSQAMVSKNVLFIPPNHCANHEAEEYFLGVCFPSNTAMITRSMASGIAASTLLLLLVLFAMYYIVYTHLRHKKLSEMKNDFINNMTHEFKTPLSTISLAAEVLHSADPAISGQRIKKYSAIIKEENQRLRAQVDHILKTAMLQKRKPGLQMTVIDMHQQIRKTINNMCLEEYEKTVRIYYSFYARQHKIFADKLHVNNIIMNLISNAEKYSGPETKIWIKTENRGNDLCIIINDNGKGIDRDKQKHIFDKFYRISSGNLHDVKGFGLGLYYVKEMVTAQKGRISVESVPKKGTTFTICFPCIQETR